jgi:hypothetical protein
MVNAFRSQLRRAVDFGDLGHRAPYLSFGPLGCHTLSSGVQRLPPPKVFREFEIEVVLERPDSQCHFGRQRIGCSDIEELDRQDKTPLGHAVLSNNEVMVKLLLEKGANTEALKALGSRIDRTGRF